MNFPNGGTISSDWCSAISKTQILYLAQDSHMRKQHVQTFCEKEYLRTGTEEGRTKFVTVPNAPGILDFSAVFEIPNRTFSGTNPETVPAKHLHIKDRMTLPPIFLKHILTTAFPKPYEQSSSSQRMPNRKESLGITVKCMRSWCTKQSYVSRQVP